MNVVTTFIDKRREKQIKYERSMLRELTINALQNRVKQHFASSRLASSLIMNSGIEEACYDVAIEAYLLGSSFGRFGYYGESIDLVKSRSTVEERHLIDTLYHFFLFWGNGEEGTESEALYHQCEQYVDSWWRDGFVTGKKKYKLRLH
ncbi:YbaK family protein [Bacillus sp. REN3]|uniref:YbaK family protein n=1 Tax=Bacillus sp. REN3 TaxID=2802440 RepID=UPI001AED68C4|nr:YbaK family protein [Bacillus sp. REN3]